MVTVAIPLHSRKYPGLFAIVDEEDYALIAPYEWCPARSFNTFYVHGTRKTESGKRKLLMMHRLIMGEPDGVDIDHEDRNGLNNSRANLRLCTNSQNQANKRRQKNNTSGFVGVVYGKKNRRWKATVSWNGAKYDCGSFATAEEAALARDAKAVELQGDFASPNMPDRVDSRNIPRLRLRPTNTTGYRGVYYRKDRNLYAAQISVAGKQMYLGCFVTAEEAARTHDAAARSLLRERANCNFDE